MAVYGTLSSRKHKHQREREREAEMYLYVSRGEIVRVRWTLVLYRDTMEVLLVIYKGIIDRLLFICSNVRGAEGAMDHRWVYPSLPNEIE